MALSTYRETSLSNTAKEVDPNQGKVYAVHIENSNAAKAYLQLYDAAAANVVVGTTAPKKTLYIPAAGGYDFAWPVPVDFDTAIAVAATTTATGGTAPSAGLLVNIDFA